MWSSTDNLRPDQEYTFGTQPHAGAKRKRDESSETVGKDQNASSEANDSAKADDATEEESGESAAKKQKVDSEKKSDDTMTTDGSPTESAATTGTTPDAAAQNGSAVDGTTEAKPSASPAAAAAAAVVAAKDAPPIQAIRVKFSNKGTKRGEQRRSWPGGSKKPYLRFVLYKENMETARAVGMCQEYV